MASRTSSSHDRTARRLLAAAAVVAAVQAVAHAYLFVTAAAPPGSVQAEVEAVMKAGRFDMGGPNSYWQMYFGYGLVAALSAAAVAMIIAALSRYEDAARSSVRPVVLVLLLATLAHAALVARYFFALPVLFDLIVATLLAAAWFRMGATRPAPG